MSQVCCVEDCNHSRSRNKCTLKRFPTDSQKCKLWEDIIKREGWERASWDRICECHFSEEQFEQNRADGLLKLRWDAIPTLFGTNLRIPARAATEEVVDKKDREEGGEENDDLEELEVEIDENSNSDECSDVETYIVTGDLGKTIQVIKEKESSSTTRNSEKQSSESPPSKKTKRIVIKVPSSVGDCAPEADAVEEDIETEEDGVAKRSVEEEKTLEESCSAGNTVQETCRLKENVEESDITDRSLNVETPAEEQSDITDRSLNVETPAEEQNPTAECDTAENVTGNVSEGSAAAENLQERVTDVRETEQAATESVVEESSSAETNTQATDTEMSEPQISEEPSKNEPISTVEVNNSSTDNVQKPEHLQLTDTDLSQLKSDWKNPKLKARDVKKMACGGSSRILYKKKHQVMESKAVSKENVPKDGENVTLELSAETCTPASENLETLEVMDVQKPQVVSVEEPVPEEGQCSDIIQEQTRNDEEHPVDSAPDQAEESVSEAQVDSGIAEEQDRVNADSTAEVERETTTAEVSDPREVERETTAPDKTIADETIASIEKKLQKIFSNVGQNVEDDQEKGGVEFSADNLSELANSQNEEQDASTPDQAVEVVNPDQQDKGSEQISAVLEETENPDVPPENDGETRSSVNQTEGLSGNVSDEVDAIADQEKQGGDTREPDLRNTSTMENEEVPDKSLNQSGEAGAKNDSAKDDREKSPDERQVSKETKEKSSKETPKGTLSKKSAKETSEPKATGKASQSTKEGTPESKKHESHSMSRKNRDSRDGSDESRRRRDQEKHSNHKDSSKRTDSDSAKKPEKVSRHNSHSSSSRDEKASPAKQSSKGDEGKKNPEEQKHESDKKHKKVQTPSKESASRQSDKSSKTEAEGTVAKSNTKTKEQPKELRSSKRCLISSAPPKRKQSFTKEEDAEEEEKRQDFEVKIEEEDEKRISPVNKKAKIAEEASAPAQMKRRGRPPKGKCEELKESSSEKAPPEEVKSLRQSKRTPKPTEKYKDSQSGKSSKSEAASEVEPRRTQKRKLSSEDEEEGNRRSSRGVRSFKRKTRASSPPRRRLDAKSRRDEEDEDDGSSNAQSICRVCGTEQQILLSIFGPEGTQLRLEDKIHTHLPIRVRQHDKLPLGVCHSCVVTLSACDSLVDKCTQVDRKLRKMFHCPADETVAEEADHVSVRKEKPNTVPTEKAPQVAEKATKQVAQSKQEARTEQHSSRSRSPVKTVEVVKDGGKPAEPRTVKGTPKPEEPKTVKGTSKPEEPKTVREAPKPEKSKVVKGTPTVADIPAQPQESEVVVEEAPQEVVQPQVEDNLRTAEVESNLEEDIPLEMSAESGGETDQGMDIAEQLAEAMQHDAIMVKTEDMDSEMVSPMKRFGNTYSTGRRSTSRVVEAVDATPQDRNSVIVIPPAETLRTTNNDVPPHSEEYILSMDESPDDAPKTVIDSILDDWDEDDQASTSANNRILTIKNNPNSEIVVTRLYNDEEEMLAEEEGGEIIIQIQTEEFPGENREDSFWPTPDPSEETIIPDTEEQQNLTWKCGECGLRGKSVGNFLEHKKVHQAQAQEKRFFCSLCDQIFSTVDMLALHKKEKHYDDDEDDDDDDEDKDEDDDVLSVHSNKSKSLAQLDIEEGGFYPGGNCKLYKCAQCDKMFGAAWSWKKHMEAHQLDSSLADSRVHKCDICNRVFFEKSAFEDHKLTHTEGETPFQCSICDAKFATWNVFLTHVHTHKSSKTICKKCGRDFGDVKTLREHSKDAHPVVNEKKFACHLCDKVCRKKIALTEHLRKHTGETPFECEFCHKRFSRLANYRAHAAIHENLRRFACDVCGKRFNRQSIQQRHMKTHMRDTIKTSHVCRVCGEAFNKVNELLEHRLNHTRDDVERAYWMDVKVRGDPQDFSCKVCEMRFTTVEAVLLHMPSHTDDERDIALKRKPKAYTCDICHRTLWSKRTYQTHKQWHEQKQYPCNQCDRKYATQTGLNYHMFLHTGERPFQCTFCDKCYKNKNDLRIHIRLHTGEYPYKCKYCPKAFRSPSSLVKHGDAHTEERPFKCSFCDHSFKRENTRANHERIHTNDKRFTCKYCNKGFIQKGACVKHEKWHENDSKKNENQSGNQIDQEDIDSKDSLELPEHSESGDSMNSYSVNMMEEHDVKEVDVVGLAIHSQPSQPIVAEPVDEANATAPSSADKNVHITLLG